MPGEISLSNTTFEYLKGSSAFLNLVLNNITNCVLLLNKNMELRAFNDSLKTIFSNKSNEHLLYKRCGEAIGCAHTVEEEKDCGSTSQCKKCKLRIAAMHSYSTREAVYKERVDREFYTSESKKELRNLRFSTRHFYFEGEYYIIAIIDDITTFIRQEKIITIQEEKLAELTKSHS